MSESRKQGEEEQGFTEALEELTGILERIEGEETDIDRLPAELQRAADLLSLCRAKIHRAEVEVDRIVQSLESEAGGGENADQDEAVEETEEGDLPF